MREGSRSGCRCADGDLPDYVSDAIEQLGGLDSLSRAVPDEDEIQDQVKVFKALSSEIRIRILWLVSCCDMCPCVLKEYLKIGDSTLSYHLNVLENTDLITGRPEKNWRIFSITEKGRQVLSGGSGPKIRK